MGIPSLSLIGSMALISPMHEDAPLPNVQHEVLVNDAVQDEQITAPYLKDLEELGYCIIPQVLSTAETELLYERVWHEYIEKAWPHCRMEDRSNWKETFPIHNDFGVFAGAAGQTQVMWDLRQDPRIINIFARIWNTSDLIVSMDGLSIMCPPEIREGCIQPWPHVDQAIMRGSNTPAHNNNPPMGFVSESSLKTQPFTIQGQFLFEDSFEGDGGFYCIPGSHLRFNEFAPELERISAKEGPKEEKIQARDRYIGDFFALGTAASDHPYQMKHITAPRGSLILWDSRTVHWNQHADREKSPAQSAKVRMVGYVSYVPKARLTDEARAMRREAVEKGISTGHNPAHPQLKPTLTWQGLAKYIEDPSYVQPEIHLTPVGEALQGL